MANRAVKLVLFALLPVVLRISKAYGGVISTVPLYLRNSPYDPSLARSARNIAYFGQMRLGTPAVNFTACFDTGSADLWLPSLQCTDLSCIQHMRFNPLASSTAEGSYQVWQIQYGTGAVRGYVDTDTLALGTPELTITNQSIGEAEQESDIFQRTSCDGLFGLAFPNISTAHVTPPFFNMIDRGLLQQNIFSLWLNPNQTTVAAGELVFGGINAAHFTGVLNTIPLSRPGFWEFQLGGVQVGVPVPMIAASGILDSGTSGIVMSSQDASAINSRAPALTYDPNDDVYTIPCSLAHLQPDLTIVIAGVAYSIPNWEWIMPQDDTGVACMSIVMGAATSSTGMPIVLGAAFLRHWYSVYNYNPAGSSISLARSAYIPGLVPTSGLR